LANQKGNTVSNLSSSRALQDITEERGGQYFSSAVGEVNVVTKMKEVGAIIGGEGNGGVIYPELHYGRDALVGIALILTKLARSGKNYSEIVNSYPAYYIAKNKIELTPQTDIEKMMDAIKEKFSENKISTIDGVRIYFEKEWVHLRKSNTEHIIRIYAESHSLEKAEELSQTIIKEINNISNKI
jgi:phosphomannomutase